MSDEETRDPMLQAMFAEANESFSGESGEAFVDAVMDEANRLHRWTLARRLALALALALIAIPAQDLGLLLAQGLLVQLIDIPNQLVADLLAPINSVGGALSIVLLGIRTMHRRLLNL